jgi:ankyrin repeat protein
MKPPVESMKPEVEQLVDDVERGNIASVREALEANPELIEARYRGTSTLLHVAAAFEQVEIGELLINTAVKRGINKEEYVNATAGEKTLWTSMHHAARTGNTDFIQLLADNGGKAGVIDRYYRKPRQYALDYAESIGSADAADLLKRLEIQEGRADRIPEPNKKHAEDAENSRTSGPRQQGS